MNVQEMGGDKEDKRTPGGVSCLPVSTFSVIWVPLSGSAGRSEMRSSHELGCIRRWNSSCRKQRGLYD